MKILFTGGGTGGHFYPIIAVADEITEIVKERRLIPPQLYFVSPTPYDEKVLFERNIIFKGNPAGKKRNYFSLLNYLDIFKTGIGILRAILLLFVIYPDVVFSKGGFAAFPTVFAARLLRIPVVVHDSDAVPGRVSLWASKFARSVAISYPEAEQYFERKDNVAYVGNPVRRSIEHTAQEGAYEFLKLDPNVPSILIIGGSQGSQKINETMLDALPDLLDKYQVIHQTGEANYDEMMQTSGVVLANHPNKERYKPFAYLNELALRMAGGIASIVVSRAGSGLIFEIAQWGIPSVIIPIPESISRDQQKNAYAYARSGAATVIDEQNLTPHLLTAEIDRLMANPDTRTKMGEAAKKFSRPDAGRKIAEELIAIGLEHEA